MKRGRPSKITDKVTITRYKDGKPHETVVPVTDALLDVIRVGNYLETAAASVGVDRATVHRWLKRHAEFRNAVEKAQGQAEAVLTGRVMSAGSDPDHWQANAWMLERKWPEKYGQRIKLIVGAQLDDALDRLEEEFKHEPEVLERALRAIAGEGGGAVATRALDGQGSRPGLPPSARLRPGGDAGLQAAGAPGPDDGGAGEGVDE